MEILVKRLFLYEWNHFSKPPFPTSLLPRNVEKPSAWALGGTRGWDAAVDERFSINSSQANKSGAIRAHRSEPANGQN